MRVEQCGVAVDGLGSSSRKQRTRRRPATCLASFEETTAVSVNLTTFDVGPFVRWIGVHERSINNGDSGAICGLALSPINGSCARLPGR